MGNPPPPWHGDAIFLTCQLPIPVCTVVVVVVVLAVVVTVVVVVFQDRFKKLN
jgi:hypothetical protein